MRKTSLIATAVTLALAGAPISSVATASTVPDPIAHAAAQDPIADAAAKDPIAHAAAQDPIAHAAHNHGLNSPDRPVALIAYARKACAGESHKHIKGQKGTPFSQCVRALKTLGTGTATSPKAACRALSHKHVKGTKGTPFSRCVSAARQQARAQRAASRTAALAGPR